MLIFIYETLNMCFFPLTLWNLCPSWALLLFSFSSSVRLCESDACCHIFGQGSASSISGGCPHACEVITHSRSKTVGALFMHCWKVRYSAEVRQQSIATPFFEVMTSPWLSAPSQIQAGLCVQFFLFCIKGHDVRHEVLEKSIHKQCYVFFL